MKIIFDLDGTLICSKTRLYKLFCKIVELDDSYVILIGECGARFLPLHHVVYGVLNDRSLGENAYDDKEQKHIFYTGDFLYRVGK